MEPKAGSGPDHSAIRAAQRECIAMAAASTVLAPEELLRSMQGLLERREPDPHVFQTLMGMIKTRLQAAFEPPQVRPRRSPRPCRLALVPCSECILAGVS